MARRDILRSPPISMRPDDVPKAGGIGCPTRTPDEGAGAIGRHRAGRAVSPRALFRATDTVFRKCATGRPAADRTSPFDLPGTDRCRRAAVNSAWFLNGIHGAGHEWQRFRRSGRPVARQGEWSRVRRRIGINRMVGRRARASVARSSGPTRTSPAPIDGAQPVGGPRLVKAPTGIGGFDEITRAACRAVGRRW